MYWYFDGVCLIGLELSFTFYLKKNLNPDFFLRCCVLHQAGVKLVILYTFRYCSLLILLWTLRWIAIYKKRRVKFFKYTLEKESAWIWNKNHLCAPSEPVCVLLLHYIPPTHTARAVNRLQMKESVIRGNLRQQAEIALLCGSIVSLKQWMKKQKNENKKKTFVWNVLHSLISFQIE